MLIIGPSLFILIYSLDPGNILFKVIAVTIWMVSWWVSEAVPIPITALLPLLLFPLLGIFDIKQSTAPYASPIVFLFMGGFMIAIAMEKHNLHKRIALSIIKLTGTNPRGVILGFMLATALLSMWISNTATTVMMLPVAISIIKLFEKEIRFNESIAQNDRFSLKLLLSIAYAANIGGIATIIGTPPNLVLVNYMQELHNIELDFNAWLLAGLPISLALLFVVFYILTRSLPSGQLASKDTKGAKEIIQKYLDEIGSIKQAEKYILAIFLVTVSAWIFKHPINDLLGIKLNDTIISMMGGLLMFIVPFRIKKTEFILNWEDTKRLPWGIIILFGGGLCLAKGMESSGIIQQIGNNIVEYSGSNPWALVFIFTGVALIMTEFISNVALVTIFLPVVMEVAGLLNISIIYLALPATLAASCAFMMPISTPPNAVVFASGEIRIIDMIRKGFILNIISVVVIVILCHFLSEYIL